MSEDPHEEILARLERVLDPCSCMTDRPLNIVELGLVEEISWGETDVSVELVPTSPICLYMGEMIAEATAELRSLPWVDDVSVTQRSDRLWHPERMTGGEAIQSQE